MREGLDWYNQRQSVRSGEIRNTHRLIYSGQLGLEADVQ
jgi:hypothetical protein